MAHLPLATDSADAPIQNRAKYEPTEKQRKYPNLTGHGRKKGVSNQLTTDLKAMILGALDDAGGREYLHKQANVNPTAFMSLVGKVLPTTLVGDPKRPIVVSVNEEERRREVDAAIDAVFGVTNNVSNMIDVSNGVSNMIEHEADPDWPYHCEVCGIRLSTDRSRCRVHTAEAASAADELQDGSNAEPDGKIVQLPHTKPHP